MSFLEFVRALSIERILISYSHGNEERPAADVSAARKRLVDAFAQYDALAKRIRTLPCPAGQNSSQDRIQMAIVSRANLFLQKNMFPLQVCDPPRLFISFNVVMLNSSPVAIA